MPRTLNVAVLVAYVALTAIISTSCGGDPCAPFCEDLHPTSTGATAAAPGAVTSASTQPQLTPPPQLSTAPQPTVSRATGVTATEASSPPSPPSPSTQPIVVPQTSPTAVSVAPPSVTRPAPSDPAIYDKPKDPAVIQVCIDTSSAALKYQPALVTTTLAALAGALRPRDITQEKYRAGIVVQVWQATPSAPPIVDRALRGLDPEVWNTTQATGTPDQIAAARKKHDDVVRRELVHKTALSDEFQAIVATIGQAQPVPTESSDVIGCINRANLAAQQWSTGNQRRLLVVVGEFPTTARTATLTGSLEGAQVLLYYLDDQWEARRPVWNGLLAQWGLESEPFDGVLGDITQELPQRVEEVMVS